MTSPAKPRVYVETSIVSYLTARPARDIVVAGRQQATRDWWETASTRFELVVSQLVREEPPSEILRRRGLVLPRSHRWQRSQRPWRLGSCRGGWWIPRLFRNGRHGTRRTSPSPRFTASSFW